MKDGVYVMLLALMTALYSNGNYITDLELNMFQTKFKNSEPAISPKIFIEYKKIIQ